jgi:hypothetical protein
MKTLIAAAALAGLSLFCAMASAEDGLEHRTLAQNTTQSAPPAVQYDYSQKLDIKRVISMSDIPNNVCAPVQATMLYEDSKGQEHNMQYTVMGNGCQMN